MRLFTAWRIVGGLRRGRVLVKRTSSFGDMGPSSLQPSRDAWREGGSNSMPLAMKIGRKGIDRQAFLIAEIGRLPMDLQARLRVRSRLEDFDRSVALRFLDRFRHVRLDDPHTPFLQSLDRSRIAVIDYIRNYIFRSRCIWTALSLALGSLFQRDQRRTSPVFRGPG